MQVEPGFFSGKEIEITCKGFKNPIYPDMWGPFSINIFDLTIIDGKSTKNQITYIKNLKFDATNYNPVVVPKDQFKITVGNPVV